MPVSILIHSFYRQIVIYLLEKGAKTDVKTLAGMTPADYIEPNAKKYRKLKEKYENYAKKSNNEGRIKQYKKAEENALKMQLIYEELEKILKNPQLRTQCQYYYSIEKKIAIEIVKSSFVDEKF